MYELTEKEKTELCKCSIERTINCTMEILYDEMQEKTGIEHDKLDINLEDWIELKPIILKLWANARQEILKKEKRNA